MKRFTVIFGLMILLLSFSATAGDTAARVKPWTGSRGGRVLLSLRLRRAGRDPVALARPDRPAYGRLAVNLRRSCRQSN